MQLHIENAAIEQATADAIVFICFEREEKEAAADPVLSVQDGWLAALRESGEFTGKLYEWSILHRPAGVVAKRLVVIGGGKREKFSSVEARRIAGTIVRTLRPKGIRTVMLVLESAANVSELVLAAAEGAVLGGWEPDKYKSDPKKNDKTIVAFSIAVPGGDAAALADALNHGRIIGESQNVTRDLVNEPPNLLIPSKLAEAAEDVATTFGLECDVLDQHQMKQLGMGALLGVAQGSDNPPFLIVLKYVPADGGGKDHLALVGKGVTFDTGGISIKPADGMEKMKYDMAGAGAVIAAMRAIAQLKPKVRVTGYIPTVENMLSGNAQRPGDIVTTLSGKTVEVLNTDAEGRLILADALTYAKRHGATHIVDAATLTGAIGIALGHHNMGAFTNDEEFLKRFMAAVRTAGEKAWQLPMDEEYKDYLKCVFADLPNIGGRHGGSITAAWFLREFADPTPWIHLDIAATAWIDDGKAWLSKGPTGVAARSFIQLALDWNE
jgi:leucyl aminopeptidase